MTYASHYNHLLPELQALPRNKVQKPRIPVDVAAREGEDLYKWAQPDKEILVANGLDWDLVESLPQRAGALRQAESDWLLEKNKHRDSKETWRTKSPEGLLLRNHLIRTFRFAFQDSPIALKQLNGVLGSQRQSKLVQDLLTLATLGSHYAAELEAIHFNQELLKEACVMSDELSELLSEHQIALKYHPALHIRNRAFTYLQMAVKKVRKCGRYSFHEHPSRLMGYASQYRRLERKTESVEASKIPKNVIHLVKAAPIIPQTETGTGA